MSKFRASIFVITVSRINAGRHVDYGADTGKKRRQDGGSEEAPTTAVVVGKPAEISVKVALGAGAVNDSTIKAGEKVSLDIYLANDKPHRGMTFGFKLSSADIKAVVHVADSGNGLNKNGDIRGRWLSNT